MKLYDTLVIGGGPAGVTAVLYLVRAGCSAAWVERFSPGGQMVLTEAIDNYPGFPDGIKGWELADKMVAHLEHYSPERYAQAVSAIEAGTARHTVTLENERISAKTVIICSGASHRKLGLPNEDKLVGRGVSYCALCDGHFFKNQDVAVVGGGNSALEESLYLAKLVRKLYLIHRRDAFRADRIYQDKVLALTDTIQPVLNTVVTSINGDNALESLSLRNVRTQEERELKVDGLFVFAGFEPQGQFLPAGLALDAQGFIVTDTEMRTNLPGIFAAGDIRSKLCRQVATAVGDGATAGHAASIYLEQLHA
ncbi:MAG: thioredoxin-disulfide reductase [Deltaproteobacteria bacterium]|jgi:thioredoxin reductase (NADPH)|nr:thioredoxin-disulfide reductase [Deltaproteobacteria bacterium]